MSLGLCPRDIPWNLSTLLCFPHKNITYSSCYVRLWIPSCQELSAIGKKNVFFPANSGVENVYLSRYLKEIIDFISFILPHIVRERNDFVMVIRKKEYHYLGKNSGRNTFSLDGTLDSAALCPQYHPQKL